MSTAPIVSPSPAELLGRAIAFGLLAVAGIAAIVIEHQPASWRASRPVALGLATLSVAAIVVALVAV